MGSFTFADLFAGIGGTRAGFEQHGGNCVFTCEISEEAQETYERNWDDTVDAEDIKDVDPVDIPDHDVLLACWPCPSFSRIGDRDGLADDRGSLFYQILQVLKQKQPEAFFLENVKDVRYIHDENVFDIITRELKNLGYTLDAAVLNALDFGLPQKRERLIIIGTQTEDTLSLPDQSSTALTDETEQREALESLLLEDPRDRFIASEKIRSDRQQSVTSSPPSPSVWYENRGGKITPQPHANALRANASWNYQLIDGVRRFTPRELYRLQGFPDDFEINRNNESRARRLTGNSIPVPMVTLIAERLLEQVSTLPTPGQTSTLTL